MAPRKFPALGRISYGRERSARTRDPLRVGDRSVVDLQQWRYIGQDPPEMGSVLRNGGCKHMSGDLYIMDVLIHPTIQKTICGMANYAS